jgi:hypothetical protein
MKPATRIKASSRTKSSSVTGVAKIASPVKRPARALHPELFAIKTPDGVLLWDTAASSRTESWARAYAAHLHRHPFARSSSNPTKSAYVRGWRCIPVLAMEIDRACKRKLYAIKSPSRVVLFDTAHSSRSGSWEQAYQRHLHYAYGMSNNPTKTAYANGWRCIPLGIFEIARDRPAITSDAARA